jgi:hypothetical protein
MRVPSPTTGAVSGRCGRRSGRCGRRSLRTWPESVVRQSNPPASARHCRTASRSDREARRSSVATAPPNSRRAAASASLRQRRCSSSLRSGARTRRRRAYAPDATGPAKWRFRLGVQTGVCRDSGEPRAVRAKRVSAPRRAKRSLRTAKKAPLMTGSGCHQGSGFKRRACSITRLAALRYWHEVVEKCPDRGDVEPLIDAMSSADRVSAGRERHR